MIRVCIVAPKYMTGGQAIEARRIIAGFSGDPEIRLEMQPIDPRIPRWIARIRGVRTIVRMPFYLFGLLRCIARADLVHICTAAFSPFWLTTTPAVLLSRALGKPVLLNYRDGRAADHLASRPVRWVIRLADRVVFPSGFLREVFRRFGIEGEVVSNVVDTEAFRFRRRDSLRPVLLSSRLLEPLYAVENTIRAFALLQGMYPSGRLIIIGGGDQEGELRALVQREGIPGVEFHGSVAHETVPYWFDQADIFVNSSREDNMPHSIIEAFSAGLPVVTTDAGGIPFIVRNSENGLLVEVDEAEQMAEAVGRLLEEPEFSRALIQQARTDCDALYSWPAAERRWRNLYRSMAGGSRTTTPARVVAA